jgi:hypothetical protein
VAGFPRQRGDAAHEGAANAEDVNMHRSILGTRGAGLLPVPY